MELALLVWAAEVLPAVAHTILFMGVILLVGLAFLGLFLYLDGAPSYYDKQYNKEEYDRKLTTYNNIRKAYPKIICTLLAFIMLATLVPSQKTIYMMAGAYGAQSIATSESAKKVIRILETKLDSIITEQEEKLKKNGS